MRGWLGEWLQSSLWSVMAHTETATAVSLPKHTFHSVYRLTHNLASVCAFIIQTVVLKKSLKRTRISVLWLQLENEKNGKFVFKYCLKDKGKCAAVLIKFIWTMVECGSEPGWAALWTRGKGHRNTIKEQWGWKQFGTWEPLAAFSNNKKAAGFNRPKPFIETVSERKEWRGEGSTFFFSL